MMLSCLMYFVFLLATTVANSIDLENDFYDLTMHKTAKTDKVDLKVYYECLCDGCRAFHTGVLYRTYAIIGSYIDLKTYPYGNAMETIVDGKTVIVCQHGEAECFGNKLHACASDILKNVSRSEFYNTCMMWRPWGGQGSTEMDAIKCGQFLDIDSKPIIECAKSQRGEDLLEYYGRETDKLARKPYVPFVLLNGEEYHLSDYNLFQKVCEALINPPPLCKQHLHSTK